MSKSIRAGMALSIVLMLVSVSFSQDVVKEKKSSNVEAFAAQDGILMKKEFFGVGDFHKCKIEVSIFTDMMTSTKRAGLRFSLDVKGTYTADTKVAFLDPDELDALSKSIDIIRNKVVITTPAQYTEVNYFSRGGFQLGCYWSDNAWTGFMKLEKFDSNSYLWFKSDEFQQVDSIIQQAKQEIATK